MGYTLHRDCQRKSEPKSLRFILIPWAPETAGSPFNTSSMDGFNFSVQYMTKFQIFESVFLITCLIVSTMGNGYVIWLSKQRLKQKNAVCLHVLILSLSLADILQGLFQTLPYLLQVIIGEWSCGELMCKIHAVARAMLANVSISTLAIIAFNRCINIETLDGIRNMKGYVVAIAMVWMLQAGVAAPFGVWNTVLATSKTCNIPLDNLMKTKEYTLITRVVCYFLPLVAMWLCNIGVILKLKASTNRIQPFSAHVSCDVNRQRRHHRVTVTSLLLATIFTINLTPFESALIVLQMDTSVNKKMALNILEYLWLLTVLNSCVNPFIYGLCFKDFRQRLSQLLANVGTYITRTSMVNRRPTQSDSRTKTNGKAPGLKINQATSPNQSNRKLQNIPAAASQSLPVQVTG
ncbi:hypothetical protein Btru_001746 [Bulinus truncatus]|nr:hypothetical protein Btru_001746 [Bulinus truncatus]